MKCPRDGKALVFIDDGQHLRDRCAQCEGVLLDRQEVAAALGKHAGTTVALERGQIAALPEGTLACPRDQTKMRRLDHRKVELDLCPECSSLWLDAGEIEKIRGMNGLKKKGGSARAAAVAGAAAVAAGATVAAAAADKPGLMSGIGEVAGELAVEGVIEVAFEFIGEALGALLS